MVIGVVPLFLFLGFNDTRAAASAYMARQRQAADHSALRFSRISSRFTYLRLSVFDSKIKRECTCVLNIYIWENERRRNWHNVKWAGCAIHGIICGSSRASKSRFWVVRDDKSSAARAPRERWVSHNGIPWLFYIIYTSATGRPTIWYQMRISGSSDLSMREIRFVLRVLKRLIRESCSLR